MKRKPTYCFDDLASLGIDEVPNEAKVVIKDNGSGGLREVLKVANTGLDATSTIGDFLADTGLYREIEGGIAEIIAGENIVVTNGNEVSAPSITRYTLTADAAISVPFSTSGTVVIQQDATGGHLPIWDEAFVFGGIDPVIASGAYDTSVFTYTTDTNGNLVTEFTTTLSAGDVATHRSMIFWDSQSADTAVTMDVDMEYSNDGGVTFSTLAAGVRVVLATGTGGYILRTDNVLTQIDFDNVNSSNFDGNITVISKDITDSTSMFKGLSNLTSANVSDWNVSGVVAMHHTMYGWSSIIIPPDMSLWDVSSVIDANSMMFGWSNITTPPDVSSWDVSSVTDMYQMMYGWSDITIPPDISNWDVSGVTDMYQMMVNWSTITVPPDMGNWNVSSVTNMGYMLFGWSSITVPPNMNLWDVSSVTTMSSMMSTWSDITVPPDVSSWDVSSVTDMYRMMYKWSNITVPPDMSLWDVSSVTDMYQMMYSWSDITIPPDISNWDVSSVIDMGGTMYGWSDITIPPNVSNWDVSSVTDMGYMMYSWTSIIVPPDVSSWDVSSVTTMYRMMYSWTSITTPPDMSLWDVSSVTNMSSMLDGWSSITEIDDTAGVHLWTITSLTDAASFVSGSKFAQSTMDKILINWEAQTHQPNVIIDFGTGNYTLGGTAETAYNALVADGWIITGITGV